MANLRLLGSRILVRPLPLKLTSDGGLFLIERYQDNEKMWEVVQVGPKVKNVEVGDKILTDSFPSNLNVWSDGYRILREEDALMRWK